MGLQRVDAGVWQVLTGEVHVSKQGTINQLKTVCGGLQHRLVPTPFITMACGCSRPGLWGIKACCARPGGALCCTRVRVCCR